MRDVVLIPKERDWMLSTAIAIGGAAIATLNARSGFGVVMGFATCIVLQNAMKDLKCARRVWDVFLWIGFALSVPAVLLIEKHEVVLPVTGELICTVLTAWFLVLALFGGIALCKARETSNKTVQRIGASRFAPKQIERQ